MALVYGQIESLKKIRKKLDEKGITKFNSIGDIKKFLKNFENNKEEILFGIEHDFDLELDILQTEGYKLQKNYDTLKSNATTKITAKLNGLKSQCVTLNSSANKNAIKEVADWYLFLYFKVITFIIEKNFDRIIWLQTYRPKRNLTSFLEKVNKHSTNRQAIISMRCAQKFDELKHLKTVVTTLNPLIAGAIGENLVAIELKKLPTPYVVFNDFSLDFARPIYNKYENDRIFSIQIDHLIVTNAGIFIIETKNWSQKSIERFDLRSPVQQIQRASYALFVVLNSKKSKGSKLLRKHHWGGKKIPIRNVVAMINHKPKEKFKFVTIKKLGELNGYINYFDPIFDDLEVSSIAEHLRTINN